MSRVFALVPAAGKSSRMGRPKLALPLAGRTVLENLLDTFRQARIDEVLVVLGPHSSDLAERAQACGANVLGLPAETPDMRATVMAGLDWLAQNVRPGPDDAWLLSPADHPTLHADIIRALRRARAEDQRSSIFIPTYAGRRGHPVLVAWSHVASLRSWPPDQPLNQFFRAHAQETRECAVEFPEILEDLDTPEDYARLVERLKITHGGAM
jgi:molybdenum cofactor cytidylyltransferase